MHDRHIEEPKQSFSCSSTDPARNISIHSHSRASLNVAHTSHSQWVNFWLCANANTALTLRIQSKHLFLVWMSEQSSVVRMWSTIHGTHILNTTAFNRAHSSQYRLYYTSLPVVSSWWTYESRSLRELFICLWLLCCYFCCGDDRHS